MLNIGFTGTQHGMTEAQQLRFRAILGLLTVDTFHHGDCIGADSQVHDIVLEKSPRTHLIIHPPINGAKRAFKNGQLLPAKDYITRNHDIVDGTDVLIACPNTFCDRLRSGTWATIRYARKCFKPITIILPNGQCTNFNEA